MPRLLLIENDPSLRLLYELELSRAGYAVKAVRNLAEAMEEMQRDRHDVAVSEMRLPDSDGAETYHTIREHARPSLPLVINTGSAGYRAAIPMDDRARYVVKTSDVGQLIESVSDLLGSAAGMQSAASAS